MQSGHRQRSSVDLVLTNFSFGYNGRPLTNPISAKFSGPELYGLVGQNGIGKTTLLRACLGLGGRLTGSSEVRVNKHRYTPTVSRWFGHAMFLPQRRSCFLDLTVQENFTAISRAVWSSASEFIKERWEPAGSLLASWKTRKMRTLSGGERQLVTLCGFLASKSAVILLDEPTEGLDNLFRVSAYEAIRAISSETKKLVLATDHDHELLTRFSCEVFALSELGLEQQTQRSA